MAALSDYPRLGAARARLAEEWTLANPQTPEEIANFYQNSSELKHDLDEWHAIPERQRVTEIVVQLAGLMNAQHVIDIGCGVGHDLKALKEAGVPRLSGVEPNELARWQAKQHAPVVTDIHWSPLEEADLLLCIDVLEHLPNPEAFIEEIATRAKVGCFLVEMTATHDAGTPLHLKSNHGWNPGHVLERYGWWVVDRADRTQVWERKGEVGGQTASILACIYRSMSPATHHAILELLQSNTGWRERVKPGDALIARSRSVITTTWWAETNDDVFLMVDDDVTFTPQDAERIVKLCRDGYDIICGAYPVHNGEHLAIKMIPGAHDSIEFGAGEPIEIRYAATGFMAVHRKVIDALVPTLPMVQPWMFYPLFQAMIVEDEFSGDMLHVSEDWGFCEMARKLGFKVWLDPQAILEHESLIPVSIRNMDYVRDAVRARKGSIQEASGNGRADQN